MSLVKLIFETNMYTIFFNFLSRSDFSKVQILSVYIFFFPKIKNNKMQQGQGRKVVASINDITHLGGRRICQKVTLLHRYVFIKMDDKWEEGSRISKNWVTSIIGDPWWCVKARKHLLILGLSHWFHLEVSTLNCPK